MKFAKRSRVVFLLSTYGMYEVLPMLYMIILESPAFLIAHLRKTGNV